MLKIVSAGALALTLSFGAANAQATDVIIPGGAGGGYDTTARLTMKGLEETGLLSGGVNFTNKGGAGGTLGLAEFVARSAGKSDSLLFTGVVMVGGVLINNTPVTLDDVSPLARLTFEPSAIAVSADSPINTLADLEAMLAKNPGAVPIGGGSIGSVDHITAILLAQKNAIEGTAVNYVPSDSGAEIATLLAGGSLVAAVSGVTEFKPLLDAGRLKILAVSADERLDETGDIPTFKEAGFDLTIGNWRGVVGAKDMPEEAKAQWIDRFSKLSETPEWQAILDRQGLDNFFLPGEEFGAFIASENDRWKTVLEEAGVMN